LLKICKERQLILLPGEILCLIHTTDNLGKEALYIAIKIVQG